MVPALAALLADAAGEGLGDLRPVFGTELKNDSSQLFIFLFRPRRCCHVAAIAKLKEAFVAFYFRLPEDLADTVPGGFSVALDKFEQ